MLRRQIKFPISRAFALAVSGTAAVLSLIVASFLLYARLLSYPPVWDVHTFVQGQPFLREPANLTMVLNSRALREALALLGAARIGTHLPDFSSDVALHEATVAVDPFVPRAHLARLEADGPP